VASQNEDDFYPYDAPKSLESVRPIFERPSLAEIGVFVAILVILVGLLLPAVTAARRAGRRPPGAKNWMGDVQQSGRPLTPPARSK